MVKLQIVKVKELDECGSLVLSNLVTEALNGLWGRIIARKIFQASYQAGNDESHW